MAKPPIKAESHPVPDTASLMAEIGELNKEINTCDEQIAYHHLEKEKYEDRKKVLDKSRQHFKDELNRKLGEVVISK